MDAMIKNEKGVLHLPLALLTIVLVLSGLAMWALLHHWKTLARTQLRLDNCTGETALELKDHLKAITSANQHIQELRVAEAAILLLQPDAAQVLRLAAVAESYHQEAIRGEWIVKEANWAIHSGCGQSGDVSSFLPPLSWARRPPDPLGPQPLDLKELEHSYRFETLHGSRASAAEVYSKGEKNDLFKTPRWHARWVQPIPLPRRFFGTSLR